MAPAKAFSLIYTFTDITLLTILRTKLKHFLKKKHWPAAVEFSVCPVASKTWQRPTNLASKVQQKALP